MLKFLFTKGYKLNWNVFVTAVERGDIEMIQWLHEVGCGWNTLIYCHINRKHKFKILNWIIANGYKLDDILCEVAIVDMDIRLLRWALAHGCKIDLTKIEYVTCMTNWAEANGIGELLKIKK